MRAAKKNPVFFILVIVLALVAVLCFWFLHARSDRWDSKAAGPAIQRLAGLPLTQTRRSGTAIVSRLQSPFRIDGFPCAAGWVHFYDSGQLKAFFSDGPVTIQGNRIPSGTWVRLNADSTLAWCAFPEDTDIQGYSCRGGRGGAEGVTTGFYSSGRLSAFFPRENVMVQGILCEASVFSPVYLHENGNLKQCALARDEVVGNQPLSQGQTFTLSPGGQVQSVSKPYWFNWIRNWTRKLF